MTEAQVLNAQEAGEILGLSSSTIYDGVRRGEIPNVGRGRSVRIPRRWVDEQLAAGSDAGGITVRDQLDRIEAMLKVLVQGLAAAGDVARAGHDTG